MRRREEHERVAREIGAVRAPGEGEALERAVALGAEELRDRPRSAGGRLGRSILAGVAVAGAGAALVLTPAGAEVRDWMADAIDDDSTVQREALTNLPSGGEVLVSAGDGVWIVGDDGERRRLGDYEQATFSPRGLFVAASRENELTALTPEGEVRWSISRPALVRDPVWAPSGYRIAYREGLGVAVVAGDGTEPRVLAAGSRAAPSWRPPPEGVDARYAPNELTYFSNDAIRTMDVDSEPHVTEIWFRALPDQPREIDWVSPDRLVLTFAHAVRVYDRSGRLVREVPIPRETLVGQVAASPDGTRLAIVLRQTSRRGEPQGRLMLARIEGGALRQRTVFAGSGTFGRPFFSPDGSRVLLPWLDTDQWLFISPADDQKLLRRVIAVGDIARGFDPGGRGPAPPPRVEGWCCP